MTNRETFETAYRRNLAVAVERYPVEYGYIAGRVDEVAGKMMAALDSRSYNKDGRAFKSTCKELGLAYTYKAIEAFITC